MFGIPVSWKEVAMLFSATCTKVRSCVVFAHRGNVINATFLLTRALATSAKETQQNDELIILAKNYAKDDNTNVTSSILSKVGKNLPHIPNHPLKILKDNIHEFMYASHRRHGNGPLFTMVDNIPPVVTIEQNFDSLLVPKNHVSRSRNDNYYINNNHMLRAHTSAHQVDLMRTGLDAFLVTGDVYRRDEIDKNHYPVFHQMEGVRLFTKYELYKQLKDPLELFDRNGERTDHNQAVHTTDSVKMVEFDLKNTLSGIVENLCGKDVEMRWVDTYFPFTHPSWELEVNFNNEWLEVLGCGVMEQELLNRAGAIDQIGWAFGIGLERLAMRLFNIPDIRLFWSEDTRFLEQFCDGKINEFKPFSKYPPTYKDIAFWTPEGFSSNDLCEVIRNAAGDIVEKVEQIDSFIHPKTREESQCYRITYRAMDKTFHADEINAIQDQVRDELKNKLQLKLR
ncbi:hypothetical protein QZH41_011117 [Actinostola sp. cb2023]|nr:hypothetical protein QZH41_011117 [Actinostola sp. cb2023]